MLVILVKKDHYKSNVSFRLLKYKNTPLFLSLILVQFRRKTSFKRVKTIQVFSHF